MKSAQRLSARRQFMIAATTAALIGLAVAGCSSPENDSDDGVTALRIALGWVPNVEYAGFWIAEDAGYYEDEGLRIEWIPGGPDAPSPEAAVAAGNADIGLSVDTKTFIDAVADGNPFTLLGTVYQRGPGCLLSMADDPVRTPADLPGKTYLAQDEAVVAALFAVNGLEPDYQFVPTSFDPGALVEGQGDAYTAYITNQAVAMQTSYGLAEGQDFTCVLYADLNYPTYSSMIFADSALVDSERDAIVGFLRASTRGWLENADDPEVAAHLAVDNFGVDLGLDVNQQILQNTAQIDLVESDFTDEHGILRVDEEYLAGPIYDGLEASGSQDLPPTEGFVDQTLLDDAQADSAG